MIISISKNILFIKDTFYQKNSLFNSKYLLKGNANAQSVPRLQEETMLGYYDAGKNYYVRGN